MPEIRGVGHIIHDDGTVHVGNFGLSKVSWAGVLEEDKFAQLKQEFGV